MPEEHIRKREHFLDTVIRGLTDGQVADVLRIFLNSSREYRVIHSYPSDMCGKEYERELDKEFEFQKEKVMEYIRSFKNE